MGGGTSQILDPNVATEGRETQLSPIRCYGWIVPKRVRQWTPSAATSSDAITVPPPGPGQVRVKLYAAAVNPIDAKRCTFGYQSTRFLLGGSLTFRGMKPSTSPCVDTFPYPYAMGVEGAGVIESVGWSIEDQSRYNLEVGDRVAFMADTSQSTGGTFCQYAVVNAYAVGKIPFSKDGSTIDFVEAATIPNTAGAAYVALFDKLRVQQGRSIFISGASGGVGTVAVQLSKYAGLNVLASCSTVNVDYVKQLGADFVFDYTTTDVVRETLRHTSGIGVDYLLELADATLVARHAEMLRFGGSACVLPGAMSASDASSDIFFRMQLSLSYVCLAGLYGSEMTCGLLRVIVEDCLRLYQNGAFRICVEKTSINRLREALDVVSLGHTRGKIVLTDFHSKEPQRGDTSVDSHPSIHVRSGPSPVSVGGIVNTTDLCTDHG